MRTFKKTGAFFARCQARHYQTRPVETYSPRSAKTGGRTSGWTEMATVGASVKAPILGTIPCIGQTETRIVVAITGCVVVAIRYTCLQRDKSLRCTQKSEGVTFRLMPST